MQREVFGDMPHGGRSVLIVEDDDGARRAMVLLLTFGGFAVQAAESAETAIELLRLGCHPDVALVDLDLPGMNGADFIVYLRHEDPEVVPILITAAEGERVAQLVRSDVRYFRKPFNVAELLREIGGRLPA